LSNRKGEQTAANLCSTGDLMKLSDALSLREYLSDRDYCEIVSLASDLAESLSDIEAARGEIDDQILRIVRAEQRRIEALAALDLMKIRLGIGD
jgi:hypothetical protein